MLGLSATGNEGANSEDSHNDREEPEEFELFDISTYPGLSTRRENLIFWLGVAVRGSES